MYCKWYSIIQYARLITVVLLPVFITYQNYQHSQSEWLMPYAYIFLNMVIFLLRHHYCLYFVKKKYVIIKARKQNAQCKSHEHFEPIT